MITKLKTCAGCGGLKRIWKRVENVPYCLRCYLIAFPPQKKTSPAAPVINKPYIINKRSAKREQEEYQYQKQRKLYLLANDSCKAQLLGCTYVATEIHHKKGRIGKLLNEVLHWIGLCHNCHTIIENNPKMAKKLKFSLSRLSA